MIPAIVLDLVIRNTGRQRGRITASGFEKLRQRLAQSAIMIEIQDIHFVTVRRVRVFAVLRRILISYALSSCMKDRPCHEHCQVEG